MARITEGRLRNRRTNERSGTLSAVEFVTHARVRVVSARLARQRGSSGLGFSSPRTVVTGRTVMTFVCIRVTSFVSECSNGTSVLVRIRLASGTPESRNARLRIERSLKKTRKLSFYLKLKKADTPGYLDAVVSCWTILTKRFIRCACATVIRATRAREVRTDCCSLQAIVAGRTNIYGVVARFTRTRTVVS